jgi:mono/diheme cytochrome c family protein
MAATDKTYRSQKTLDIVFAVSCGLMLLSIVWMLWVDYNREFKQTQRTFRDVETGVFELGMLDKVPTDEQMDKIKEAEKRVKEASDEVKAQRTALKDKLKNYLDSASADAYAPKGHASDAERWVKTAQIERANLQTKFQDTKSKIDSQSSFYDEDMERIGAETNPEYKRKLQKIADERKAEIEKRQRELNDTRRKIDAIDSALDIVRGDLKIAEDAFSKAEDDLKKLTADFDRLAKTTAQKTWKAGDWIRALPVLDGFASPTKPNQITLKSLPIDYGGFSDVTRFDRCTTCHLGIDRANFDRATLTRLTDTTGLQAKLEKARKFLKARQERLKERGEDLGFDPDDLPTKVHAVRLSRGEITEYCAHPRLELFVDPNSKHPMEKFGCTSCHAGQGSATDFTLAAHTPGTIDQKKQWSTDYGWASSKDWEFPMYSSRFVESSCVKCHHQITDLISNGTQEEAPKLLRGYNLVRENGCFGCHEISGIKSGREIGPDLRLEPNPPLDFMTPEEQNKARSDPTNPPGTMRKVGPSLYRISEKTNQEWARSWLNNPRGFRSDTRMPHFYNLSTNSPDVLPADQKAFPAAEVHSVIAYLFDSSDDYLRGADDYRKNNLERQKKLKRQLSANEAPLADADKKKLLKELDDVEQRLKYAPVPTPLTQLMVDEFGTPVALPPKNETPEHLAEGRRLFSEKGCLACHSHEGTAQKTADGIPPLKSDAHFGPNLSRIAAKIAPKDKDGRRWLVQWIMNPNVHFPRTRMPITHLKPEEAAAIADWLLKQPSEGTAVRATETADWDKADIPEPSLQDLANLARVYLLKVPGMTQVDVEEVLGKKDVSEAKGISPERAEIMEKAQPDADELKLRGPIDPAKVKWYIGKKTIGRMGCYACHNIPGFEAAKPIGTALNDWGKKDPERLAFEDADAWVKEHHTIADRRDGKDDRTKQDGSWKTLNGKSPFERYFFEALEHHQREGFLHLKLAEPRSYDFGRLRPWDDRLRMPQFHFSRPPERLKDESEQDYLDRSAREEAKAREDVMTFILGLVAEPVPAAYLNEPKGDRAAEVQGRKVIDKFNCAGCHQVSPGVYDYKLTPDAHRLLEKSLNQAKGNLAGDYQHEKEFAVHNAWIGQPYPAKDRLRAFGVNPRDGEEKVNESDAEAVKVRKLRLAQALRIADENGQHVGDLPASEDVSLLPENIVGESEVLGGAFPNLLVPYLKERKSQTYTDDNKARSALPPPLEREGERTQPAWLYGFLKNPEPVRPTTWMALRMPKFNMSDDEAKELVNYFAGVDRLRNPGTGLTAPYLTIEQHDDKFWSDRNRDYAARMGKAKLEAWTGLLPDDAKKKLQGLDEKKRDAELRKLIAAERPYEVDAFRILLNEQLCLQCHPVGTIQVKGGAQGPPLDLSYTRLRPEWTQRWMANPKRMFTYDPNMPSNFAHNADNFRDQLDLPSLEQATALRDVLMNLPKVADVPANRKLQEAAQGKK